MRETHKSNCHICPRRPSRRVNRQPANFPRGNNYRSKDFSITPFFCPSSQPFPGAFPSVVSVSLSRRPFAAVLLFAVGPTAVEAGECDFPKCVGPAAKSATIREKYDIGRGRKMINAA